MEVGDVLNAILLLIGFCMLLFFTYLAAKFVGTKQSRAMKGKNIKILETVPLGMDKRLHLVKAGDRYVLIASTSKNVEFLTVVNLDEQNQKNGMNEVGGMFDFKALFEKCKDIYIGKMKKSGTVEEDKPDSNMNSGGDFKGNLDRLKSILQKKDDHVDENGDESTSEK